MYAEKNEYLKEAAEALCVANAEEIVRQQCRARKDADIREMRMQYEIQELEDKNAALENEIASLRKRFEEMNK